MLRHFSINAVVVFIVAVTMTAGCAKQDVVKKDEGIVPVSVSKQPEPLKTNELKTSVVPPKETTPPPVSQAISSQSASTLRPQTSSPIDELKSALEKIYFDFDSAGLSESARGTLSKNAAAMAKEATAKIRIEGNCDERGSTEYNLALGERRAKAAQQYLTTLGINSDRLSIISYGKEKPAVQGNDEAAWSKNRRDEFVIITK